MLKNSNMWFVFYENQLIVNADKSILTEDQIATFKSDLHHQNKMAFVSPFNLYCAELKVKPPSQFSLLTLRQALEIFVADWYTMVAKAYALINWDKDHHYCGFCGSKTIQKENLFERDCPNCHRIFHPRISPSVIVLIHRGEEILMARGHHFIKGAYGLVAGFIEPGENAEAAVYREVEEEVSINIKNLEYFGSQSWPFPDSLMFGFIAEYAGGEIIVNHDELEDAGWHHYSKLPGRPSTSISIASKLIEHFIKKQGKL